jgi:hypothetical protein
MKHVRFYNLSLNQKNLEIRKNLYKFKTQEYQPSLEQKQILNTDIFKANKYLFEYKRILNIPWNFIFLNANEFIENNYPHTHADIIFLPSDFFLEPIYSRVNTLIHEKIHIFQRLFPIPYHKILFNVFKLSVHSYLPKHPKYENIRQNPDNNLLLYKDKQEYILPILHDDAVSIADVSFEKFNENKHDTVYSKLPINEHPNETLAYFLTKNIIDKSVPKNIKIFL